MPDIERIEKWVLRIAFDDEKNPYLPKSAARATVPGGPSVPCSTAKAVEWDAAWSQNLDLSGRAALGVHVAAYEEDKAKDTRPKKLQAEKTAEGIV
uniref:Asparagine synthetase domain-containing protein n=1 Tax=Brassica oleracea var. oleracea TaxID=109376 RepID=A0A0D3EBX0_BRAOL